MKNIITKYPYPLNFIYDLCDVDNYQILIDKGFCEYSEDVLKGVNYIIDNSKHSDVLKKYYREQITFKEMQKDYNCRAETLSIRVRRLRKYLKKENNLIYIKLGYTKAIEYLKRVHNSKNKIRQEREKSMLFELSIDFLDIDIQTVLSFKNANINTIEELITTPERKIKELRNIGEKRIIDVYNAIEEFMGIKIEELKGYRFYYDEEGICIGGTNYGYEEWYYTKNYVDFYKDEALTHKLSEKGKEVWRDSIKITTNRKEVFEIMGLSLNKKEIQYKCTRYIYNDDNEMLSMIIGKGKTPIEALNECINNKIRIENL